MTKSVQLSLSGGERIFINGAVIKVDRRVSIELLNDVPFLQEQHILQPADTTTPLRQLYFVLQTMLMDSENADQARRMFEVMHVSLLLAFTNGRVLSALLDVKNLVGRGRVLDALKTVRSLFPIEDEILGHDCPLEARLLEAV